MKLRALSLIIGFKMGGREREREAVANSLSPHLHLVDNTIHTLALSITFLFATYFSLTLASPIR